MGKVEGKCMIPDEINFGSQRWLEHIIRLPNGKDSVISETDWKLNESVNVLSTEPWGNMVYDNPEVHLGRYLGVLSSEQKWLVLYRYFFPIT